MLRKRKRNGNSKDKAQTFSRTVNLIKNETLLKRKLVYGIVYEPEVKDTDGDYASAEEIEKAAHDFLPRAATNVEHEDNSPDVEIVESYIAPVDLTIPGSDGGDVVKKGSWVLVSKINDTDVLDALANGELTGYSLEGTAKTATA